MNIQERLAALRLLMKKRGMDAYLVPSGDCHQSEYTGEHFKAREFITGFTGSAGTAVITMDGAGLWTDGRYFLQAASQLRGSGITLYRAGEANVPSIESFLLDSMPYGGVLGFDGKVLSMKAGLSLEKKLSPKKITLNGSEDLIGQIWKNRPPLSAEPVFALPESCTGESAASKLARIRGAMKEAKAQFHLLASLDDINWLTNLRGNDIEFFPMFLSYALITDREMFLYADSDKFSEDIRGQLMRNGIELRPYGDIYEAVRNLPSGAAVLANPSRINHALYRLLAGRCRILEAENPSVLMKSIKNETEQKNILRAHVKDGISVTRFMYWLKNQAGRTKITEISAKEKLESFRREQDGYLHQSFEPIFGFGEHGAIVHYSATPESDLPITPGSLLLSDTGGSYYEGSTDITRTFAIGEISPEMKDDFTTVLLSHLRLSRAVFPHGTETSRLDVLARQPLWERGLDYQHGTGHGVGYLLNIHEAPISFGKPKDGSREYPLEEGMVITNEPGLYREGKYGIRIENEMLVRKSVRTSQGEFMRFETITYAPIDLDAVNPDLMTHEDKKQLNAYHARVRRVISPYLNDEEAKWLKEYTRAI